MHVSCQCLIEIEIHASRAMHSAHATIEFQPVNLMMITSRHLEKKIWKENCPIQELLYKQLNGITEYMIPRGYKGFNGKPPTWKILKTWNLKKLVTKPPN